MPILKSLELFHLPHINHEEQEKQHLLCVKVIDDDMPENIFTRGNELSKVGLDVPYPERLKHELAKLGIKVPKKYLTEKELVDWLWQFNLKN